MLLISTFSFLVLTCAKLVLLLLEDNGTLMDLGFFFSPTFCHNSLITLQFLLLQTLSSCNHPAFCMQTTDLLSAEGREEKRKKKSQQLTRSPGP